MVALQTAIKELNTGIIEFVHPHDTGMSTEGEVVTYLKKLQEYFDIGLTPAQLLEVDKLYAEKCREVAELKKELERYKPKPHVIDETCCKMRRCNKCDAYRKECERLKVELEQSVKLPCKVGDNYVLVSNSYGELFFTIGWNLTEITIVEDDIILDFYCSETMEEEQRSINSFGKTIFLTQEETEQVLKGGAE